MSLANQLESILFVASKPLSVKRMAKVLNCSDDAIISELQTLFEKYAAANSGIVLLNNNDEWQMVSNPENRGVAENFVKAEISGELTRPQLETLTVVAYCGPITKPELDQLRGVNCALILRNLMIRGLVKESDDSSELLPKYEVTMDFVRHLGLQTVQELPDFNELHQHQFVQNILDETLNTKP